MECVCIFAAQTNTTHTMKTESEIRVAAFRLIDSAITLKDNDIAGCPVSGEELDAVMPRLEKVKEWMLANNQQHYITNYFNGKNYGLGRKQFLATDMKNFLTGHKEIF